MLTSLELKSVYDSEGCDLVKDLIVPLLSESSTYMRGVGYFSSGWLRLASHGILSLIQNGGRAQIITSPILSKDDLSAFIAGEEAKKSSILKKAIEDSFDGLQEEMNRHTLNALSWMVADDLLEFRFAIPRSNVVASDYHDKVGIFEDEHNNIVAIHGSLNDSVKGSFNGEAFSVFKSWEPGQNEYVEIHRKRLSQLWHGENKQFHSMGLSESVKKNFIKLRTTESRPYVLKKTDNDSHGTLGVSEGISLPIKLRGYQGKAIRLWRLNGHFGVLGMATGTGKTLTALSAAVVSYLQSKKIAVVVLVPYLHLLDQWAEDCRKCGFSPILCSSEHPRWQIKVKGKIQDFNIGSIDNICIVAVHATASTEKFEKATRKLPKDHSLVIGDEVHNLGGAKLRSAMLPVYGKRLGLSATPKRWFDDEGTDTILEYFGDVCFEFSLEEAIENNYLTPYKYVPGKTTLTCEEQEEYEVLSKKISKLSFSNSMDRDTSDSLKYFLLERARLISGAENKILRMLSIFKDLISQADSNGEELKHILVYCASGTHKDVLSRLSRLNLRCHEFVHSVGLKERHQLLDQFGAGKIQVLIAVKCLDEGVDIPATKVAFFLSSTSNPKEFVQRRGRVLRKFKNKDEAILYDFFVVPQLDHIKLKRDIDAGMLKREMPRFAEFSSAAKNQYEARQIFWDLLDRYDLLHLLDQKPWDVYQEMKDKNELLKAEEGNYV